MSVVAEASVAIDPLISILDGLFQIFETNEGIKLTPIGAAQADATMKIFGRERVPFVVFILYRNRPNELPDFRIAQISGGYIDPTNNEIKSFTTEINGEYSNDMDTFKKGNYEIVAKRTQNFITIKKVDVQLRF